MIKPIFLLCFLFSILTSAQFSVGNVSLEFSESIPKEKGNVMTISGVKNDSIYALSRAKKEFFFQTYDAKTKRLTSSKVFSMHKDYEIRDYVFVGNKRFLMVSSFNAVSNQYQFIALEVSNNEIVNTTIIHIVYAESWSRKGEFLFKLSNDGSKYSVTHVQKNYRNPSVEYTLILIDENLTKIFVDKNTITSNEKRVWSFKFSDTKFTNDNDIVFALIESYRDKEEKNKYNQVTIFSYKSNNAYSRTQIEIELKDNYLVDCNVVPTKDNRLHITGFFSKLNIRGKRNWEYEGIYDIVIDTSKEEVINKKFNRFAWNVRDIRDLNPDFVKNIAFIERDNGGIIVFSEYDVNLGPSTIGIWPLAWTSHFFESEFVIVTALDADGNLNWADAIPKLQLMSIDTIGIQLIPSPNYTQPSSITFPLVEMGSGEEYLSIFPIYIKGKLTVFYNDHYKSTDYKLKVLDGINEMKTVAYTFEDDTGMDWHFFRHQYQKGQINLKPLINYKLSDNRYLIYGGNKKENAFGEIIIENYNSTD
jgi:hypothetical protein